MTLFKRKPQTLREKIIYIIQENPEISIYSIANQTHSTRDQVKDILIEYMAESNYSRLPALRKSINSINKL